MASRISSDMGVFNFLDNLRKSLSCCGEIENVLFTVLTAISSPPLHLRYLLLFSYVIS